ncbi:MAG: PAS domain S-box protein [Bacteroidota bacterium]|jgi:PAS domain S-box-containing protein
MKHMTKTKAQLFNEVARLRKHVKKIGAVSNKRVKTVLLPFTVLYNLFNSIHDEIFVYESPNQGGVPSKFLEVNRVACKQLGYTRAELLQKSPYDIHAPETIPHVEAMMKKLMMQKYTVWEGIHLAKNGHRIPVEVSNHLFELKGKPTVISAVKVISSRKRVEEALQHERNFLRVLIDNLPDLFYYKDEQGRYILNNPAHLRSIGAKCQEDVVGKTTFDYHPRELAEKYFEDEMKVVQSGEAMIRKEELCFRRDTGKMHWHLTSKIPVKDGKGKVTGFICISHDITEQKRVQEAFEHERNLLRTLIDTMPELINYKDLEGRYLLNNRAHLQSLGVEHQEDVLGKTMFDFHPAELVHRYHEHEMQVLKTGEAVFNKEEIVLHRDTGEQRWHLTSKVPLKDNQGKVTSIISISADITDRKHFEEALEHERNLLRTLIDNLPVLIFSKDTEGRYVLNNLPHLRSIGVQRQEDALGKTTFDFNPPELAKQYSEDEMKVVQTNQAMYEREELAFHRDTGEQRWHLTSKIPLVDSRGKVIGMVGIASDITERKNAEVERERMIKELQDALADIKTLSGLVPICANCKKIRDDKGFWMQVESYIQERSQARFSHGICPDCMAKLYPGYLTKK